MAIECLGTKYFAISSLFVKSIDGNFFTFPSPYSITIESDFKKNSTIEICYASFYGSPLVLDYIFDLFFYVISFDGKIETSSYGLCIRRKNLEMNLTVIKEYTAFNPT
jgi:hypothetical protein